MKKVLFVLLSMLIISACSESGSIIREAALPTVPVRYTDLTNPLSASAASAGEKIFRSTCATCHGSGGHGDGPAGINLSPPPKDLSVLQLQVSDGYLFWRISEGSPGTAMVAWRGILSDEQIWQLVTYIRSLK